MKWLPLLLCLQSNEHMRFCHLYAQNDTIQDLEEMVENLGGYFVTAILHLSHGRL